MTKLAPGWPTWVRSSSRPVRTSYTLTVPLGPPAANRRSPETLSPRTVSPAVPGTNTAPRPVTRSPR
ncbi:MAG TPA: hypothetical protein VI357_08200 [Mycobacteriales bacterium]